jgi:hypothetical protein
VPALTGYIDKAKDKEHIMRARDYAVAVHAVFNEAYANGEFANNSGGSSVADEYVDDGWLYTNMRGWYTPDMSLFATGSTGEFNKEVSALLGEEWIQSPNPGWWRVGVIGSKDSTWLNADGFRCEFWTEGRNVSGKPVTVVTYKINRLDVSNEDSYSSFATAFGNGTYESNAGYEVYHLIYP